MQKSHQSFLLLHKIQDQIIGDGSIVFLYREDVIRPSHKVYTVLVLGNEGKAHELTNCFVMIRMM